MVNPGKILGHNWAKRKDTLELPVQQFSDEQPVMKGAILSHLGSTYYPLKIISPTTAEGKRIYREACHEKKGWNTEVLPMLRNQWLNWTKQLKNITVPRSIMTGIADTKAVHLLVFADASSLVCCAATVTLVEHESGLIKGLLMSKSGISKRGILIARLELISGHMAANLEQNICHALKRWPVETVTVWMDSMVALYWILNPGKSWKVFVVNRVRKMARITEEVGIQWKYCPTERNLADIGSRGASLKKMENCEWYEGPQWLLRKEDWPEQLSISCSSKSQAEERPVKEIVAYTNEQKTDEWDFAGPLKYKVNKREEKAYVLMFTCATSTAVHLELTRTQSAEEFQRKLNAFITRRTRPQVIISDKAATFKATATWIQKIRKSERLQDFFARQ